MDSKVICSPSKSFCLSNYAASHTLIKTCKRWPSLCSATEVHRGCTYLVSTITASLLCLQCECCYLEIRRTCARSSWLPTIVEILRLVTSRDDANFLSSSTSFKACSSFKGDDRTFNLWPRETRRASLA